MHLAAKWKLRMLVAASSQGLVYCNDYYWEEYIVETGEGSRRKKRENSSCTLNEKANPKHGVD